jgi:tetratricopeptide (TPR) repeat protein
MPPASIDVDRIFAQAVRHRDAGRLAEAEHLGWHILAADPNHADSLHLLGLLARETGRLELAIGLTEQAIAINPRVAVYHSNLGNMLGEQGNLEESMACFVRALALDPDFAEAQSNLAHTLGQLGRLEEAVALGCAALNIRADSAPALHSLGNLLWQVGRIDESVECCRRAVALRPDDAESHNILGIALRQQGALAEALACSRKAVALKPDMPEAHTNLAMALLAQGAFAEGWAEYEWRWQAGEMPSVARDFAQPQWRGEPAAGRTLLVHAEQGFGDTLQFCRFATSAASLGLRVILEVPAPLLRLMRGLPGVERVIAAGDALPAFDLHCPMLSLPLALGTTLETIPSPIGYLHADPAQAAMWRARLGGAPGLRVGLAWAGNPRPHSPGAAAIDRRRSIDPALLAPLMAIPGVRFGSVQKGGPPAPSEFPLLDAMDEMADFADTAALIANLDLVISIDSAVAHLAAALGRPVWLLDRFDCCWRWLIGRRDSPWYPTLRIYRQPRPSDWPSVLAEVAGDLAPLASKAAGVQPVAPAENPYGY